MYRSDVTKEFEDGEITDSDHERENNTTIDQQRINTVKQIKPPKKFFTNSDSESDIEGICSVDEDDGICKITKVNCAGNEPPKNKFSIWSSVMHDELLSNELSSWSGVNKFLDSDRNVESYAIDLKKIPRYRKRQREESNSMDESSEETNLVDLETFGVSEVSDCQKVVLPSRKIAKICRLNNQPKIDQVNKSHHKEMLPINVRVFQLNKTDDVVTELLTTLHEPTQMREIFTLVVTTIGVERTYKLLRATEDVEGAGGVMVVKGHRRRTPGGVFLHLLKSQTTKEEQGKIFLQEKNDKQDRKKKKKLMIEEKSKRLAAMVSSQARNQSENKHANTDDNELFDASNDITDIELDFI